MNKTKTKGTYLEKISNFEEMLSTFAFEIPENKEGWLSFVVQTATAIDGPVQQPPTFWRVFYKECGGLTLTSLRRKVMALLKANGHFAGEQICDIVLVVFTALHDGGDSSVSRFNLILENIVDGTICSVLSFTGDPTRTMALTLKKDIGLGNFTIGRFPSELVTYRCQLADCDYAQRYKKLFQHYILSIYDEPHPCKAIDLTELAINMTKEKIYSLMDHYFFCMSQLVFELFFEEFKKAQIIPQAFGSAWLPVDELAKITPVQKLTIWLEVGRQKLGWVSPDVAGSISIGLGGFHVGLPYVRSELKQHFGELNETTALASTIKVYCSYLAKARVLEAEENAADALLNCVIALDLLLGKEGSSTESFSMRCAALTCHAFERDYNDLKKECKEIYNKRSKYVHVGETPSMEEVQKVNVLCREIALCLYRIKKTDYGSQDDFYDTWILHVDILAAKINANQLPTEDEYKNAGAAKSNQYNYVKMARGM